MNQSGNAIQNANLQEFLDSAENAASYGQRQFFTPASLARPMFQILHERARHCLADLTFGAGHLAHACGAENAFGLDIDARTTREVEVPEGAEWHLAQADLTHWFPLAFEAGLRFPFLALNPPFSLRWYSDRLADLRESELPEVAAAIAAHPETIDSTLATLLIALDRLHQHGEGFLIGNAATLRRFLGDPGEPDPDAPHASLRSYIWTWVEVPQVGYENVNTAFDTAVLFFSRSHSIFAREGPLNFFRAASASPADLAELVTRCTKREYNLGNRFRYLHEIDAKGLASRWDIVHQEYKRRHKGNTSGWNIRLDDQGRLVCHLTPFQQTSRKLDRTLVERLHSLHLKTPISLCVTATSRTALREAAECGVWRIHPDVSAAITAAIAEYEAEGAPFYRPSPTQALGWVDEHSTLRCTEPGIGACRPGDQCSIATRLESTIWTKDKVNLAGDREDLRYSGKELLVTLTDPSGVEHCFHVRRDDAHKEDERDPHGKLVRQHWGLNDLIQHFHIPQVKDITDLRPEDYEKNLARLDQIEARINQHLAA